MLTLAIWSAIALAIATIFAAVLVAALRLDDLHSARAESISFVRITLTGIFGIVIGQVLVPTGATWWLASLVAVLLMIALLVTSQIAAKFLGNRKIGSVLLGIFTPVVRSIHLLFTPLSLPKQEQPEEYEQELLDSVEEFGETIVREVMVPRIDMATISIGSTLSKAMGVFLSRGYSRLPVIGTSIDDIRGVLYIKDVAKLLYEAPEKMSDTPVEALLRKAIFIPESKPVDDLLREMQLSFTHIAIIIDEYGGVAGLATLEDVIEEIVGEIADEYDREIVDSEELEPGIFRLNARFSLFELGEMFELDLEDDDVDTVGGLLTKELGRLPKSGDAVTISGLSLTADRIEGRRKRLITVVVARNDDLKDATTVFVENSQQGQKPAEDKSLDK